VQQVADPGQWELSRLENSGDDQLAALFADCETRSDAIESLVDALNRSGPWAGPTGVVRLDVDLPGFNSVMRRPSPVRPAN
jgi:hypothetical protein